MSQKKKNEKAAARDLFISGMSQKDIAKELNICEHTVGRWQKAENWEAIKEAELITVDSLIDSLLKSLVNLQRSLEEQKRFPTPAEADAICKITNSINNIKKTVTLPMAVQITKMYASFVYREAPEDFANMSGEYIKGFIAEFALNKHGF